MKFSLCMIVKNEEAVLARCLDSVKGVFDEIIITDTGSVDSTKLIASAYTDKIFDYVWCDDFASARNYSFSKATGDFIMWLDADDVIEEKDRASLVDLKNRLSMETDVVMMKYAAAFDASGKPTFYYYRERLVKRMANLKWHGFVHEVITPCGNVVYEDITICHKPLCDKKRDPARNLRIYEGMLAKGARLNARETYYYARELFYNGKKEAAAITLEKYLDGGKGWSADNIGACIILHDIYKHQNPKKAKDFLARALSYDTVNPQILCLMGDMQKEEGRTDQAIFWYSAALICPNEYSENGFVAWEYERYYPLLQLCVCYDAKKEYARAREFNRLAGLEKCDSEQVRYNEKYFESLETEQMQEKEEKNSSEN